MTKLFKNSKQILGIVVAFAIIAVSLFTGVAINADAACVGSTVYWSGGLGSETKDTINDAVNGVKQAGTEADPIIIDNAEELYALATKAGNDSAGVYYKIANGIGKIILQPQDKASAVLALANAQAVREYFEGNASSLKKWGAAASGTTFQGKLDGNGVTIYGMYATSSPGGLFARVSGNVSLSNMALKNSYATNYNSGLLLGQMTGSGATATLDKVAIINNCMIGWNSTSIAVGNMALIGSLASNLPKFNNLLVYGNIAQFEGKDSTAGIVAPLGLVRHYGTEPAESAGPWFTNSIILGVVPYGVTGTYTDTKGTADTSDDEKYPASQALGWVRDRARHFSGVYTDMPTQNVTWSNNTQTYTAEQIAPVTEAGIVGIASAAAMPKLDWENVWLATKGMPELRALHNLTEVTASAEGHGYECAGCDIDAVVAHTWGADYKCTECKYECEHPEQDTTSVPADCVTKQGVNYTCKECGKVDSVTVGAEPVGHTLVWHDEIAADCLTTGVAGYWECTVCGGNYLGTEEEAKWGAMADASKNPTVDFGTPLGGHNKGDADAVIYIQDPTTGHWYVCTVCDGHLDHDSNLLDEEEVEEHRYENSVCVDCGFECKEHDYKTTGNVVVVGNCATDRVEEAECTICKAKAGIVTKKAGHTIVAVAEVKPDDKLEGTKAHYKCSECGSIFADVEGKTTATMASLVIPKTLPAGYGSVAPEIPQNADTSNKSPSTSDSLTSVLAVAALAGAAVVFARKARV